MAISITPPQPGDLITAAFMKQLIDTLTALDVRISALEVLLPGAGGKLQISTLESDVILGDTLHIQGVNFGLPSENVVTFDSANGVVPSAADGSNDKLLVIKVPLLSLPFDSQLVTVGVSNFRTGNDSRQITIRKPVATKPSGTLSMGGGTPPSVPIVAGASFVFAFNALVNTTLDETFDLTTEVPATPGGEAAWTATVVADITGNTPLPLLQGSPAPPPWRIRVAKSSAGGTNVPVFVKLTIPPVTTVANPFIKVNIASVNNPLGYSGGGGPKITFTLGSTVPANQTVQFGSVTANGGTVVGSSASFTVPTTGTSRLNFSVPNLKAGVYQLHLTFDGAVNGWGASTSTGTTTVIKQFTMLTDGNHTGEQVFISASAVTGAANLNITVMTPPPVVPPGTPRLPTQAELNACQAFGVFPISLKKA